MNHDILKQVIYDQQNIIRSAHIIPRDYTFEPGLRYVVVGLRRTGKSTLLYKRVQELVDEGVSWDQIIYINFEDERLTEFQLQDFNDIVRTAAELSDLKHYYFFDEIQNIKGWERFARRLADQLQQVYITGSNAEMLSSEMIARLGGRYMITEVMPYSFAEYLDALGIPHTGSALYAADSLGQIQAASGDYLHEGGLPETVGLQNSRLYREIIYKKVLESDIALRHQIRKVDSLRTLIKKVAETITSEVTTATLRKAVIASGKKLTADAAADYLQYAEDAYLLFRTQNYIAHFAERESTPRWYFGDNGILELFLYKKDSLLLENMVALALLRRFGNEHIFYFKSSKTGIDIDFYIPEASWAIQACFMLDGNSYERETKSLIKLAQDSHLSPERSTIVTFADSERTLEIDGMEIEVLPLWKFLLEG
ncbi:MAG: ATP-binding protein [Atopobiaceae bacterium]|jgi:predicted AAA+ superfamily ATPase|nr:ATP-binding protein [Atopobiaceae bacterium]